MFRASAILYRHNNAFRVMCHHSTETVKRFQITKNISASMEKDQQRQWLLSDRAGAIESHIKRSTVDGDSCVLYRSKYRRIIQGFFPHKPTQPVAGVLRRHLSKIPTASCIHFGEK